MSICFQICNNMFGPAEVALPPGSCLRWEGYRLKCGQLVLSLMDFCWCFGWSCGKLLVIWPRLGDWDVETDANQNQRIHGTMPYYTSKPPEIFLLTGAQPFSVGTHGEDRPLALGGHIIPRQSSQRFCFGTKMWQTQKQGSKHTDFGWFCRFLVGLLLEMSARKSSSIGVNKVGEQTLRNIRRISWSSDGFWRPEPQYGVTSNYWEDLRILRWPNWVLLGVMAQ